MYGASEEEIQEAVLIAKHTVGWSVYLNGIREDYDRFAKELKEIGKHLKPKAAGAAR
jgi:alkylhydroperoxidase/carboxymuconolactone decarboxylase family protein YurZ